MKKMVLFALILFFLGFSPCQVMGDNGNAEENNGVWVLQDVILEKLPDTSCKTQCIGESVTCYDCTNILTPTSHTYKEDHKECWGTQDLEDWGSTASWEAPPDTLIPGDNLHVKGEIEFFTDAPNYGRDSLTIQFNGAGCPHGSWCAPYYEGSLVAPVDSAKPQNSIDGDIKVPASSQVGEEIRLQYATWGGTAHYVYIYSTQGSITPTKTPSTTPAPCDRLKIDIEEFDNTCYSFSVLITAVDICKYEPLEDVSLEFRLFHLYDASTDTWFNGNYEDFEGPYFTDSAGKYRFNVSNVDPGDMYRVDAYASKQGWDTSDTSLAVTVGEGLDCEGGITPLILLPGSEWIVEEYGPMGNFDGQWTIRSDGETIDATWGSITDVIEIVSVNGNQVTLYRKGNDGLYTGTISDDGKTISGTGSWYNPGQTWMVYLK